MRSILVVSAAFAALGLAAPAARAAAPEPAPAAAAAADTVRAGVGVSTQATVGGIYTAERLRDPFMRRGVSGGAPKPFNIEDFSIHKLSLRGIMKDSVSDFALFTDNEAGVSFMLRKGRLYDDKGKSVPDVVGTMNIKEKMVTLTAAEGDVQVFRLGEELLE